MIPLRDNVPSRGKPVVNVLLIVATVAAFLWSLAEGFTTRDLLAWGIVPVRYTDPGIAGYFSVVEQGLPFLTSIFLHGGWLHLISNVWFLWVFGDNVEDRFGHLRYLFFYLACGVLAGAAHVVTNPGSQIPTIGASGAIAGVMGAYFLFFPRAKVTTLVPIFFFVELVEIPAFFFLGIWMLIQILWGAAALGAGQAGGVAWWAHVGGFAAGLVLAMLFGRGRTRPAG